VTATGLLGRDDMANSGFWDGVLRVLRDPIFALALAIFLALLSSRHIRRLTRTVLWLAVIVILIWLAAHNASSAHVEIAVVTDFTRVLLILIAVLFAVALIAMAVLLIMYFKSAPESSLSLDHGPALRARRSFGAAEFAPPGGSAWPGEMADLSAAERSILEETGRLTGHLDTMTNLFEGLFSSVDFDNPARACAGVMRIYFSGLSAHSAEIGQIQEACSASVARILSVLSGSYDIRPPLRKMGNKNWFPTAGEWAAVSKAIDAGLPYLALRIICLKKEWRAAAMAMGKSYACLALLTEIDEL
jgi:hypothetical protein